MLKSRTAKLTTTAGLAVMLCLPAGFAAAQTGTLFVEGNKVGIGTATPQSDLDIRSQAANANVIRVVGTTSGNLFRVFEMADGNALISLFDHVGRETFRFTSAGGGRIGVGCVANLSSDIELNDGSGLNRSCGTGTFSRANAGDTQFTTSSSRAIKEDLQPVAPQGVLERIAEVGVYTYDFIDGPRDRIGLMAEDFHRVLDRGSETEINGHEVQVALWLAVQELTARTDDLARRNDVLSEQNETLRREVAELRRAEN
jgi:hypothetical protein